MSASGDWRPELVALDIDGTLVDEVGVLPKAIHDAVARVVEAGVPVVLATGRSWHNTGPVAEQLGLPPGWAVSSNGAVVAQYPPLRVVQERTFDPQPIITRALQLVPDALIAVEEVGRGYRLNGAFPPGELSGELTYQSIAQLSQRPVTRVIVRDPGQSEVQFLQLAEALGLHGVSYFIGDTAWLDIAPQGVNKASGLEAVCEALAVDPGAVLALGDGRNDIEMLQWAGRGVALGQAAEAVKAAADAVTDPFVVGGTANELKRWF